VVAEAVTGGVDIVQLREKGRPAGEVYRTANKLKDVLQNSGARLLINDRIDVALAVEADGAHLGQGSLPPGVARRLLGEGRLIGVSTHDVEEAVRAEEEGADYIIFSHIFATQSKPGILPKGPESLKDIVERVKVPVIALGGINPGNVAEVVKNGTDNVAVMSAILTARDPRSVAREIKQKLLKG